MKCLAIQLSAVLCLFDVTCGQDAGPAPQYRYRNVSIPGATDAEPVTAEFASALTRTHLDTAVTLWAQQKKCVSCHTHGIYMITRPALSPYWGRPPESVRDFVVAQAQEVQQAGTTSYSTPVQFAYIARGLAEWDLQFHETTSAETDAALRYLFEMQADDGSISVPDRWPPLISSSYDGTVMAAIALAVAPGWLADVKDPALLVDSDKLKTFLRRTPPRNDHQRLLLLWASTHLSGLADQDTQQQMIQVIRNQQQADGGWSIRTFATPETLGGGKRAESLKTDEHYQNPASDGYQTGLVVVVLRDAGIPATDPGIQKAVRWLQTNQRESGRWWTRSLNTTSRFHYISFSGTAYAALALAKCDAVPPVSR